jgi:predicted SAM-dependent methyltransferase
MTEDICIYRKKCSFCNQEGEMEKLFSLQNFPVFMGCTEDSIDKDIHRAMNFCICENCGGVQLNPCITESIVYKKAHGSGTVGKAWEKHHKEFADFILKFNPPEILEIGASHNFLAKNYLKKSKNAIWNIIDPNADKKSSILNNLRHKQGFFSLDYPVDKKYDCIVHSHTFEHFLEIQLIVKKFFDILNPEGIMIFSVPNLQSHYENLFTNVMNFEHTVFLSELMIDSILMSSNFTIEEKKYHQDNHSIFYACRKNCNTTKLKNQKFYSVNKKILKKWYNHHVELVASLNNKIDNIKDRDIYLFGAHVTTQFLLSFGLNTEKITCVLDNDKNKQGKRLYGTSLVCKSPKTELKKKPCAVILRGGVFSKNIKNDIVKNINDSVIFIEA